MQARWRWYTIDLLDLVDTGAAPSRRASLHHAVHTLARAGHVQTSATCPYDTLFGSNENGEHASGVAWAELRDVDKRWPTRGGRHLWFRLRPPASIPEDDQISVLQWLADNRSEPFEDFVATLDRRRAWESPIGRFLAWLLCGRPGE